MDLEPVCVNQHQEAQVFVLEMACLLCRLQNSEGRFCIPKLVLGHSTSLLFPLASPPRANLDEPVRHQLPLLSGQLLIVAHPESGNLCLFLSCSFSNHHCQSAPWSHHDTAPPFGMVRQSLQVKSLSHKGLLCGFQG